MLFECYYMVIIIWLTFFQLYSACDAEIRTRGRL